MKKTLLITLMMVAGTSFAQVARPSSWVKFATDVNDAVYYISPDSIKEVAPGVFKVVGRSTRPKLEGFLTYHIIDCNTRETSLAGTSFQEQMVKFEELSKFEKPKAGSIDEAAVKYICN